MSDDINRICEHGGQARKCPICERDEEIDRLSQTVRDLEQRLAERDKELADSYEGLKQGANKIDELYKRIEGLERGREYHVGLCIKRGKIIAELVRELAEAYAHEIEAEVSDV